MHRPCLPALLLCVPSVLCLACGSGNDGAASNSGGGGGGSGADAGDGEVPEAGQDVLNLDSSPPDASACHNDADCDGGVCTSDGCCPAAQACGDACCEPDQTCFANACVKPGRVCHSAADCDPGEYCELSLGQSSDGDAGAPDAPPDGPHADGGPVCLAPTPSSGRCLALPPECPDPDGGTLPDGGTCVPSCEYHPPPGPLHVVEKWEWNGTNAVQFPNAVDVWSTPAIGRVYDTNCDGTVDELDPPNVIFISGNVEQTCCQCTAAGDNCHKGVLRMLDGRSGQEIWSLRKASPSSVGFAGLSIAIGDVDADSRMDILAVTGEGYVVMVDAIGNVVRTSDKTIPGAENSIFGWGGGLAVGDMDADGFPEVAYGATVFTTTNGAVTRRFVGSGGQGAQGGGTALSTFVDLDGVPGLELLAGRTAYKADGSVLWDRTDLTDGFPGVGNFDSDPEPEAVLVSGGKVWVLDGATGATEFGPFTLPGNGHGGPPTVADFDGDGEREIGVAQANFYSVLKVDGANSALALLWKAENHDLSSSVTGSTVFDFEGDGASEVIYGDECFLWVYDGATGAIKYATSRSSFTATEASLVADVDGDGHAEMLMGSAGVDMSASGWKCDIAPWNQPDSTTGRPAWRPPSYGNAHRGLVLWGDESNAWVGTRTLWNQHTYHASNICDPRDDACSGTSGYGAIPKEEKDNWTVPWLNNFRQNVQDKGLFDAPDATVMITVDCTSPLVVHLFVRNLGMAVLPAGVTVDVFVMKSGVESAIGTVQTSEALFPGQVKELKFTVPTTSGATKDDSFGARIDPAKNTSFKECRDDNNEASLAKPKCSGIQ